MENILIKYIATILVGDEYHKAGEEHVIFSHELERTKSFGLRIKMFENNWGDEFYNLYPCTIRKIVYKLEPIEITTIEGGDRMNCDHKKGEIGCDKSLSKRDWQDRW